MGCWNGTCAITQLPIVYEDEVVLIPLLSTGGICSHGITYNATDKFIPLCLPIMGTYNDYGGIENIEISEANCEYLKKLQFFEIDENERLTEDKLIQAFKESNMKSYDYVLSKLPEQYKLNKIEITDIQEFFDDFIYNEGFLVKNTSWKSVYSNTNYIMMHKGLYIQLLNEMNSRVPYGQTKSIRELWKEKILKEISEQNKILSLNNEDIKKIKMDSYKLQSMAKQLGIVEFSCDALCYDYFLNKLSEKYDEETMNSLLDLIMFTKILNLLRKGYLCITGLGHQGNELQMHLIVADFIKKYTSQKISKAKGDCNSDEKFDEKEFLSETTWWYE